MAGFHVYLPDDVPEGTKTLKLPSAEAHHLVRVLRAQVGDTLSLLDGKGGLTQAKLISISGKDTTVQVGQTTNQPQPMPAVTLAMALVKAKAFEEVVRHATEIGVTQIVPLATTRCEVKLDPAQAIAKVERWRGLAIEACKQSGNLWLPDITTPTKLSDYLEAAESAHKLVASLEGNPLPLANALKESKGSVTVAIGPEGDFTVEEYVQLRQAGHQPVCLGRHVLRAETAALYALSVIDQLGA
ncbi:MAG: RsmE family RNA methyltransferase [Verrucomicrobiota bacterium]